MKLRRRLFVGTAILSVAAAIWLVGQKLDRVTIVMTDQGFSPRSVTVPPGAAVVFRNLDSKAHWPAANSHPQHESYAGFDPERPIGPGEEWGFRFDEPGVWYFHDHLYPATGGRIVVREPRADTSSSPTAISDEELDGIVAEINSTTSSRKAHLIRELAYDLGPARVVRSIGRQREPNAGEVHLLGHAVGEVAYELSGVDGIKDCVGDIFNGCVHGLVMSAVSTVGETAVEDILASCRSSMNRFQYQLWCLHGIGHALLVLTNYQDLPKALSGCDGLLSQEDESSRNNCYYGVFMENVFGSHDGRATKTHPWLRVEEPLYPCSELEDKYQRLCYLNQPGWWIDAYKDFGRAASLCGTVPELHRNICREGFGLMLHSAKKEKEAETLWQDCRSYFGDDYSADVCASGVASARVANADKDFSERICAVTRSGEGREYCLRRVPH